MHGVYDIAGYATHELISVSNDPNTATLLARLDRRRCKIACLGLHRCEVTDLALLVSVDKLNAFLPASVHRRAKSGDQIATKCLDLNGAAV